MLSVFNDMSNGSWIEEIFVNNEVGSISSILYDARGLTLLILGIILFKSMIIAIDIAKSRV